jgi:hypothetical protein
MSPTDIVTPLLAVLTGLLGAGAPADTAPTAGASARAASADGLVAPLTETDALHVAAAPAAPGVPTTRRLQTQDGRTVLLRGVNVNALVDYGEGRDTVAVTDQDAEQARALGFTVVRLAVSWSRIAPAPGDPDEAYLDEIRTTAKRYTDRGMYVLLDMHQDRYAAGLGDSGDESDGAPSWAAKTDEPPADPPAGPHPYYGTDQSRLAAYHFFENSEVAGKDLQEHYADAMVELAKVGRDLGPGLAGIELYNEPIDPWETTIVDHETFSSDKLWPLYDRLITRLRGADGLGEGAGPYAGPIWFEPTAARTQTDADEAAASYTPEAFADPLDNLVYGPHIYTDIFRTELRNGTVQPVPPDEATRAKLTASFDAAVTEADAYGAALAPTELPGAVGGEFGEFDEHRREVLGHLDRLGIGGMVWVWKLPADPAQDYGWGVLDASGAARPGTADYGRPRVQASGPRILSETWQDGRLTVRVAGAGVVDLWDGAAFGTAPPTAGVAARLQLDGQDVVPATAEGGTAGAVATSATATLESPTSWVGGRRLRVTVPVTPAEQDGSHTLVLGPAPAVEPPPTTTTTVTTPPPATTTATTTTTVQKPLTTTTAFRPPTTTTRPATVTTPPATTVPPPSVSSLKASPRRFRPVVKGRSGGGTLVSMRLSVPARVRVLVQRAESGRRVGARCLAATKGRRTAKRCTRYVTVSTTTLSAKAGVRRWRFTGVVRGRPVRAGTYRVAVSPTDADGRRGTTRTASLAVLAARR